RWTRRTSRAAAPPCTNGRGPPPTRCAASDGRPLAAEKHRGAAAQAERDSLLIGARLQAARFRRVRHEAGFDEDRGDVGPVEAGQVAPLDEAAVCSAGCPDDGGLQRAPGP